jgi:plastocyanin
VPARIDARIRNRTRLRLARGGAVLALGLGALSACSSDGGTGAAATSTSSAAASTTASSSPSAPSSGGTEAVSITATETDFRISLDGDGLAAGSYTIDVVNSGDATHDLAVEQDGNTIAKSDSIGPGDTTTLSVDLAPGQYVFYCSIGNHRAMGMELTVEVT